MTKKNVVVFGAGAIGSCMSAYLTRGGVELTIIDPWFAHILAIQKRGLHVTAPEGEFTVKLRALHIDQVRDLGTPIDILILAVKSHDTEWSTRYLVPYMAPDGVIVSAQNGLNEEIILSVVGPEKTVGMVPLFGAAIYDPGEALRSSAMGDGVSFELGELDGSDTPRLRELSELISNAGKVKVTKNIWGSLWEKLAGVSMRNALAGLTGFSSSTRIKNPTARKIMMHIGKEVVEVGESQGIKFNEIYGVPFENYKNLDRGGFQIIEEAWLKRASASKTGLQDHRSSLLQDVIKARRSETDYLNGIIVRKGKEKGIPTPVNQAMVNAMYKLEAGEIKQDPGNLELFKEFI
jgi:2-dehydropantoate 2-reductase